MNEHTEKLIQDLAYTFGTTVEHLWGVLVRQAGVQAITSSINAAFFLLGILVLAVVALRVSAGMVEDDRKLVWVPFALASATLLMLALIQLSTALTCVANPEYWALTQLLK